MNSKLLKYDPLSQVFRKEEWLGTAPPEMEKATHYYYKGSALVQEYDMLVEGDPPAVYRDNLKWT